MTPARTPRRRTPALLVLAAMAAAATGCASVSSHDLVPASLAAPTGAQRTAGAVDVHAVYSEDEAGDTRRSGSAVVDARMLDEGLREAVERHGPFAQVRRQGADYVLDVWVERGARRVEVLGEGYVFDVEAIWRLTRTRDGKVLACEVVKGHAASRAFGSSAPTLAVSGADRDMFQRGLAMLWDREAPHLSALPIAGARPSMGEVVPEPLATILERARQNWSRLTAGMTVPEVEALLGPITTGSSRPGGAKKGHTEHYVNGVYALAFIDGKLSHWELAARK